jgi:HEAT repeat-containing taxis protein
MQNSSPKISERITTLLGDLESTRPEVRIHARHDLEMAGREAVVPLVEKLKTAPDRVCWEAAKALGTIADPASASALVDALDHDNPDVRWAAANAIIRLRHAGLRQTLMGLLTKASSVEFRETARVVVSYFAHRKQTKFLQSLLKCFSDFEPGVTIPLAAHEALQQLDDLPQKLGLSEQSRGSEVSKLITSRRRPSRLGR